MIFGWRLATKTPLEQGFCFLEICSDGKFWLEVLAGGMISLSFRSGAIDRKSLSENLYPRAEFLGPDFDQYH